jgi:Putative Actinobacterial Holin-X, holin superfamily III
MPGESVGIMAHERLKNAALPHVVTEVVGDLADLLQKEFRLAKAEISSKVSTKVQSSIWMLGAGILGVIAAFVVLQAIIFAIASYGIALHWACLIVAAGLLAIAALCFFKGRADANEQLMPARSIDQLKRDISAVKEQLT